MNLKIIFLVASCFFVFSCHPLDITAKFSSKNDRTLNVYRHNDNNKDLVVFIHGIFGSSQNSWKHSSGSYWPELLSKDHDFDRYNIYLIDYSQYSTIEELSSRIGQLLVDSKLYEHEKISFVCHSMGGLIAKRMLINWGNSHSEKMVKAYDKIRSVTYLSTPAQGAKIAEYANWLSLSPQLKDMLPAEFNSFLQSLENDWIRLLMKRDSNKKHFPKAFVAYETRKTRGIKIVPRVYSQTRA